MGSGIAFLFSYLALLYKSPRLRKTVLGAVLVLFLFRIQIWYFPSNGARAAVFVPGVMAFQTQAIGKTGYFNDLKLRGSRDGKHLIINAPGGQIFSSSDYGRTWGFQEQMKLWQDVDYLVSDKGDMLRAYATIGTTQEVQPKPGGPTVKWPGPESVLVKSLNGPDEKQAYRAGFSREGVGKAIRGVAFGRNRDGYWLLLREGYSADYAYTLLSSKDGVTWSLESRINDLEIPFLSDNFSFAIDQESNAYAAVVDHSKKAITPGLWRKTKLGEVFIDSRLTVVRKPPNRIMWEKIATNLGGGGPGEGYTDPLPFGNRIFADEKGNLYAIWHAHASKFKHETLVTPIKFLMYIPGVNILSALAVTRFIDRDDIYFAVLPRGGDSFATPKMINDARLSFEDSLHFAETGTEGTARMQKDVSLHGMTLKSSVSPSGKHMVAAWTDYRNEGTKPIYFSYSKDSGDHWSRNQPIALELTDGALRFDVVVSDSGSLHLVFVSKKDNTLYHVKGELAD